MHTHFIDRLALLNSVMAGCALFPQVFITYTTASVVGLSSLTILLILFNNIVWLLYGVHRGLASVAIAALLSIVASSALALAVLIF